MKVDKSKMKKIGAILGIASIPTMIVMFLWIQKQFSGDETIALGYLVLIVITIIFFIYLVEKEYI